MNISTALRGNAAFTAICAGICLAATDWVTEHAAVPSSFWILGLGAMLTAYVPILLFAASRPLVWLVKTIITLDWSYAAIASVFLTMRWSAADAAGLALVFVSTALVALFAWLQMRGLAAMQREARA